MIDINHTLPSPQNDNQNNIDDQNLLDVTEALQNDDQQTVQDTLEDLNPAETASVIAKATDDDRDTLINDYLDDIDSASFPEMDAELRKNILQSLTAEQVASIISELESDDALDIILNLDDDFQQNIMRKLSAKMRITLKEGLNFPEDSAGRLMRREVVAVPQFWTVGKALDYIREATNDLPSEFFDVFVISPAYHIEGQVSLGQIIRSKRSTKLETLCGDEKPHSIPVEMDQEEVAHIFRRDNLVSCPVIDEENRLVGTITIDDIVDVIDEEAQEDILKMAGLDHGDLYSAVLSTTGNRFRWLFLNLLTALLASIVISFFDTTIEEIVALAVLMPIVASMGGNAGTQTLTVAVRAIATKELSDANTWRIIWKESIIGSLNGLIFAAIAGIVTALWFASPMLGLVIGLAMIVNMIVAGFFGACIPIILNKRGADPAVSSTVFLTTMTDIVGFFVFLALASALLL